MASKRTDFRSGDEIPGSGVYAVSHATGHTPDHEVTLLYGTRFPRCRECGNLAFRTVKGAHSMSYYTFLTAD